MSIDNGLYVKYNIPINIFDNFRLSLIPILVILDYYIQHRCMYNIVTCLIVYTVYSNFILL